MLYYYCQYKSPNVDIVGVVGLVMQLCSILSSEDKLKASLQILSSVIFFTVLQFVVLFKHVKA
jgi:hypothetical protein